MTFVKLQLAGNILFWVTYAGYFILHQILGWESFLSLAVASIAGHALFFIADKEWVFSTKTGGRKSQEEVIRFIIFMGINYCINLVFITLLERKLGITPYIGQFVSGLFFTVWTFVGLRYWVFNEAKHSHALKLHTSSMKEKRRARIRRATK